MLIWGILVVSLQLLTCILVLFQRREPVSSTAWILFVLLFPLLGTFFFFFFGYFPFERKKRRIRKYRGRQDVVREIAQPLLRRETPYKNKEEELEDLLQREELINSSQLLDNLTGYQMTHHNNIEPLVNGKETYRLMEEKILQAKKYIFFQFFIFTPDRIGKKFRDLLISKARQGVRVYFLYDHLANLFLSTKFLKPMQQAGIQVERFSPLYSLSHKFQINFRNHRKLILIDGTQAFTGGLNIGREYLGENKRLKGWRDNHFFMEGEIVASLEKTFLEDWFFASNKKITPPRRKTPFLPKQGDVSIQAIPSGPNDFVEIKHLTFLQLVQTAQKSLWIQTPYFIPDSSLIHAFQLAAMRGIDVRIMVPRVPQYLPIYYASHSFFSELIEAGVKIYRYLPCFLHSKTCIIDDNICLIGSTNLDNRSFKLSFELDLLTVSRKFNCDLKSIFNADLAQSETVQLENLQELQFPHVLLTNLFRLFAPIM